MNAMIGRWQQESGADRKQVFAEDMLFATLDTSVRRIAVEQGREFLLSDTVGFIRDLPPALVEAFHSTLEEVAQADLLLQVVDVSDPHHRDQMRATRETIESLGAGHIPMITVFNKSDLCEENASYPRRGLRESSIGGETNENLYLSAKELSSIELLTEVIFEKLERGDVVREFLIPYHLGKVQAFLTEHARILETDYREDGTFLRVSCDPVTAQRAERLLGDPDGISAE
jgi:GTP-binding protein HflX